MDAMTPVASPAKSRVRGRGPRTAWKRHEKWLLGTISMTLFLAFWETAVALQWVNPLFTSSPSRIVRTAFDMFADGSIIEHIEVSAHEFVVGYGLAVIVGVPLGILMGWYSRVDAVLEPFVSALYATPRIALLPLILIWLGIGIASKIALSFILVAVLIFFTVFAGIRQVDRRLVERVVTLGGNRLALVRHVYLPSVAAWVLGNLKVAVGFAFTGACVGEFVAATHGLGYLLSFAQSTYNAALMFALILLILVVVMLIFAIAGRLERHLLRWN
jgi:NitT/TauT family transport system permease protein